MTTRAKKKAKKAKSTRIEARYGPVTQAQNGPVALRRRMDSIERLQKVAANVVLELWGRQERLGRYVDDLVEAVSEESGEKRGAAVATARGLHVKQRKEQKRKKGRPGSIGGRKGGASKGL